jgi:pimeloyl-ACP methyl ester carboxylesterase
VVEGVGRVAGWQRLRDLAEAGDALLALKDVEARRAFLRTLRGLVDARGQAVTAVDRLYLANAIPMLVIWGSRDPIVPAQHAHTVRALVPTAQVEVFEGAGHWPHLDDPDRFCDVLLDFLATTTPARHDRDSWRALLADNPDGVPGWTAS